jgi:hypothetical protein
MANYNIPKEISTELKINKSLYLFDLLFIIYWLTYGHDDVTFFYSSYTSNSLLYLHGHIWAIDDR